MFKIVSIPEDIIQTSRTKHVHKLLSEHGVSRNEATMRLKCPYKECHYKIVARIFKQWLEI
jgi:hypothetical protein